MAYSLKAFQAMAAPAKKLRDAAAHEIAKIESLLALPNVDDHTDIPALQDRLSELRLAYKMYYSIRLKLAQNIGRFKEAQRSVVFEIFDRLRDPVRWNRIDMQREHQQWLRAFTRSTDYDWSAPRSLYNGHAWTVNQRTAHPTLSALFSIRMI